jgi:glycosyltransferase involved in cell wall biosynthesis
MDEIINPDVYPRGVRILYFAPESVHTSRFIERFKKEFEVILVSYGWTPEEKGIKTISMPFKSRYLRWVPLFNIPYLKKIIDREKPDLVHAMYILPWGYYASCSVSRHVKLVISPWGSDVYAIRPGWKTRIPSLTGIFDRWHNRTSARFDAGIAECEHVKKRMGELGYDLKKIYVIPWGPDCSIFSPGARDENLREKIAPGKEIIVGCTRMLYPGYGIDRVIYAMKGMDKRIGLVLIGEGAWMTYLRRLCVELGVDDRVYFLGKVSYPDIARYVASFDIMVSPSLSDTISISVMEGMACALPVISSNVGGTSEWIQHGKNGILLVKNSPDEISEWIRTLSADDAMRRNLGRMARETVVERGDWRKTSVLISQVYRNL